MARALTTEVLIDKYGYSPQHGKQMFNIDFFKRLGIFIQTDFLDPKLCCEVLSEVSSLDGHLALVVPKSHERILETQVNTAQRQTKTIKVSVNTEILIKKKLIDIKPKLEKHFNLKLTEDQGIAFYCYNKSDFFGVHQDNTNNLDAPDFVRERRVTVIIFLNSKTDEPRLESYCGGSLIFYGLLDNPLWQNYGFPFPGEPGMLLAFPSNIWHEVKPVTHGERYTAVTWFK